MFLLCLRGSKKVIVATVECVRVRTGTRVFTCKASQAVENSFDFILRIMERLKLLEGFKLDSDIT